MQKTINLNEKIYEMLKKIKEHENKNSVVRLNFAETIYLLIKFYAEKNKIDIAEEEKKNE